MNQIADTPKGLRTDDVWRVFTHIIVEFIVVERQTVHRTELCHHVVKNRQCGVFEVLIGGLVVVAETASDSDIWVRWA
jgi:hypothetical protein